VGIESRKGEIRGFSVGGERYDGKNEEKGIWTKKMGTRKQAPRGKQKKRGEVKRAKVKILYWNVTGLRKREE
jgi:hypothetical protein